MQCEFGRRLGLNEIVGLQIRAQQLFRIVEVKPEGSLDPKWPLLPHTHTAFLSKPSEVGSCPSVFSLIGLRGPIRQLKELKLKELLLREQKSGREKT